MRTRRASILAAISIVAALLAFPMRGAIYDAVVIPVAYLLWALGLIYHAWHQTIWWIVLVVLVFLSFIMSLMPQSKPRKLVPIKRRTPKGSVEDLSLWMSRSKKGIYFKWMIANRLGRLAHQILIQRESGRRRTVFDPLTGVDWEPSPPLRDYLEAGLQRSFADYPNSHRWFHRVESTPLDHDVKTAVEFLEEQIKTE